ncbi:MAG: hypothetical protein U9O94_01445 [Nanoarchaeota archaeon]|nr:hypothetical protein [Nanoarchaeota archaeon]
MRGLTGAVTPVQLASGSESIAVASTGVVYTKAFPLTYGEYFGLWLILVSAGSPDVKVELEQSYAKPDTEGTADTSLWEVTEEVDAQVNDKLAHVLTVSPKPMNWGRYKITGLGSNPSDTVVTMKNFIQE